MFPLIYIEKQIQDHPRVQSICKQFTTIPKVICENYGEVFNRKAQNFRLQKRRPSLILAKKFKNWLLPIPETFGIGGKHNFYFSHLLNCPFDCRYCFLQGMYASAHFVFFVNFEDFIQAIETKIREIPHQKIYFFSGYDCDSLAMEPLTRFVETFLPVFANTPNAFLELRTKSIQIHTLIQKSPLSNCIIAFSLTPEPISRAIEHKTPPVHKRLEAMDKLQLKGWPLGLRFDPLIYCKNYRNIYKIFFEIVFKKIKAENIHSVSLGPFRLPKHVFKKIIELYPDEKLFAYGLDETKPKVSYYKELETEVVQYCQEQLLQYVSENRLFRCGI